MSRTNKTWLYVLMLTGGLLLAGGVAKAASASKQLQKGIEAYEQNDPIQAMDYFVDVLMSGDNEQVALANKYIDAIHNGMGGIKNPVEVKTSFPDQPTQTIVDQSDNLARYGKKKLDTLTTRSQEITANTVPTTLTEQIEAKQIADYIPEDARPLNAKQSALLDDAAVLNEPVNGAYTIQRDVKAVANEFQQEEAAKLGQAPLRTSSLEQGSIPAGVSSSAFVDLTSDSAIEARNIYTLQKLQSLKDNAVAGLTADKGIHLYMRNDGLIDAIDIDDGALFQGNAFRPEALGTLNNIYEILALTQGARYILLPPGSYTDDVTLPGIRQAMALKSYLVKRGISQGKLHYNMGLVDREVPAQFSNLKGLSIVFDYGTDLPTRLLENEDNETAPLLSMAIVPQCHAIDRSLGEAYAIDFSVLETVNTLDNWTLQVVQHGRDGNFYIVRQLEGFSPVYHQILWNGRKGIIGPELPCGKYTLVLTAVDLKGNKQTLRRRVIVKCGADPAPACQAGTCKQTQKATTNTKKSLSYKSARLWQKPGRIMRGASASSTQRATENLNASATETVDNSYTVTETVRNIVTNDTSSNSGSSYSQEYSSSTVESSGYAPVPDANNSYYMEEEYTQVN